MKGVEERTGRAFVVRITPSGEMTRFELPGPAKARNAASAAIVAGPDGDVWFTDPALGRIGRVTAMGAITEYDLDVSPRGLTVGHDGNLWFSSSAAIGRISPTGEIREFPSRGAAGQIATGPEGDFWFIGYGLSVGRVTPSGQFSWLRLAGGADTVDIATGGDGGIWISTASSPAKYITKNPLARITPGAPGIEVVSSTATVRGGQVALDLACGGSASGCTGDLKIGEGKRPIASSPYSLAPESTGVVTLSLSTSARRLLARERFLRELVDVNVDGGIGGGSTVVLRRPHPLRGAPRPGRSLLMPLPEGYSGCCIALGWDGDFWLSGGVGRLTRVTPTGELSNFRIPAFERAPGAIVAGPRRSMWFLEERPYAIVDPTPLLGRVASDGTFSEIPLPNGPYAQDLTVGPEGNLWFTEYEPARIGRITPRGKITRWRRGGAAAGSIAVGPEGNLWFSSGQTETIAVLTPK